MNFDFLVFNLCYRFNKKIIFVYYAYANVCVTREIKMGKLVFFVLQINGANDPAKMKDCFSNITAGDKKALTLPSRTVFDKIKNIFNVVGRQIFEQKP